MARLEEHCGNCEQFVWHDLRIAYYDQGYYKLEEVLHPTTGSCSHSLMKNARRGDVTRLECLFWTGGDQ